MAGCSSCWDGLGTFENRLGSVTCCHWQFCAFLSMQNDYTMHTKVVSGVAVGRASHIWLYTTRRIFRVVPRLRAAYVYSKSAQKRNI
eukprot:877887-Pleurochrysis_carterae.AAC.1